MRRDEAAIPLDEACLLIAAHADPTLDVAAELSRLDDLAAQVRRPTLDGLRGTLFSDLGFTGDRTSYYDRASRTSTRSCDAVEASRSR
ncbi:MAG: hypothetical protein R2690_10640 [Acidimicrobiales bacterium]